MQTISDLLKQQNCAVLDAEAANRRASNALTEICDRIRKGETTEDRQLDLALILKGDTDRKSGLIYLEFEQELQQHPGELVMINTSWEDEIVHYFSPVEHSPTRTKYAHFIGVISDNPILGCTEGAMLMLPIDRLIVLNTHSLNTAQEGGAEGVNMGDFDLGSHYWNWIPKDNGGLTPLESSHFVGSKRVVEILDSEGPDLGGDFGLSDLGLKPEEKLSSRVLIALGFEHFDEGGQGVLPVSKTDEEE